MTCIVGLVDNGQVLIGGDSSGVSGWRMTVRKDPKVFLVAGVAFGFTTSFRMGQLLQYSLELPAFISEDLSRFMATDFIDAVRKCLKDGGYSNIKENREEGGNFLVGIGGRLYSVESDFQVGESALSYDAIGCGAEFALGSLFSTYDAVGSTARSRVHDAIHAAECFSAAVKGPFNVVTSTR